MSSEIPKPRWSVPFRLRIVTWYGLLVMLTLFLFRLVSTEVIQRTLYNDLDRALRAEAAWVQRVLFTFQSRGIPEEGVLEELSERNMDTPRKTFIEIRTPGDSVYFQTSNLESGELSAVPAVESGTPETIRIADGLEVRRLAVSGAGYRIFVAYSLTDIENALENILVSFFWLMPLALLLVVLGGFVLVTRFMLPIRELNTYAEQMVSHPLHEELPSLRIRRLDELGRLTATVTGMVERLRASLMQVLRFASLASHELRTPLAVMRSQLESELAEGSDAESLRRTLRSTYDEVLRLSRITEDLLSLGTLQSGTFRLNKVDRDVKAFLEEFAEDARLLCEPAGVEFDLDAGSPAVAAFDASRLTQVLFNLLDNAIRHTPRGGRIGLRAEVLDGQVRMAFSDTGVGIPAESVDRIFDAFYRSSVRTDSGGSGLGLTLVKGIVEAHGGGVSVETEPGAGSTFRLWFPVG